MSSCHVPSVSQQKENELSARQVCAEKVRAETDAITFVRKQMTYIFSETASDLEACPDSEKAERSTGKAQRERGRESEEEVYKRQKQANFQFDELYVER